MLLLIVAETNGDVFIFLLGGAWFLLVFVLFLLHSVCRFLVFDDGSFLGLGLGIFVTFFVSLNRRRFVLFDTLLFLLGRLRRFYFLSKVLCGVFLLFDFFSTYRSHFFVLFDSLKAI